MPLQLQSDDPSTSRPHFITFDPGDDRQVQEALVKRTQLMKEGYNPRRALHAEAGSDLAHGCFALDPPARNPNHGVFRVLSQNGDDRIVWDRRDASQVREAFTKFKELLAKGYTAFATLASGKKGHKITEFDPHLEEVLFIPSTMPG